GIAFEGWAPTAHGTRAGRRIRLTCHPGVARAQSVPGPLKRSDSSPVVPDREPTQAGLTAAHTKPFPLPAPRQLLRQLRARGAPGLRARADSTAFATLAEAAPSRGIRSRWIG